MGKKVLITGVNGYIGRQLAWYLDNKGYDVYGYDLFSSEIDDTLKSILKKTKYVDLHEEHFDAVVHLAAVSSVPAFHKDPLDSLINSLSALYDAINISTDKFIFASSAAATVPESRRSEYGTMKVICEDIVKKQCPTFVSLRFHNVAGCIVDSGFVENHDPETHLIPNMVLNRELTVYGDGSQIRDYIHVEDICRGIQTNIDNDRDNNTYQELGTGFGWSVIDVIRTYNDVLRTPLPVQFIGERTGDVDVLTAYEPYTKDNLSLYQIVEDTVIGYKMKDVEKTISQIEKETSLWI